MSEKKASMRRGASRRDFGMDAVVEHMTPLLSAHGFRAVAVPSDDESVDDGVDFVNVDGRRSSIAVQIVSIGRRRGYVVNENGFRIVDMTAGWTHARFDSFRECHPGLIGDVELLGEIVLLARTRSRFALDPTDQVDPSSRVMTDLQILWTYEALAELPDVDTTPSRESGREVLTARRGEYEVRFVSDPQNFRIMAFGREQEPVILSGEGGHHGRDFHAVVRDYVGRAFERTSPRP